jgi:hypothetical protein
MVYMSKLKIKVIENCVSQQFVDFVSNELNPETIAWGFLKNVTSASGVKLKVGLSSDAYRENQIKNTAYWFLYPLLLEVANKNNFFVERLLRIRIGAYINQNSKEINDIHTDLNEDHLVALYYPHDTDGDTIFFDSKENKKEIFRVSPSKGKIVLFDGNICHASSNPTDHEIRMSVNYNFLGKWVDN